MREAVLWGSASCGRLVFFFFVVLGALAVAQRGSCDDAAATGPPSPPSFVCPMQHFLDPRPTRKLAFVDPVRRDTSPLSSLALAPRAPCQCLSLPHRLLPAITPRATRSRALSREDWCLSRTLDALREPRTRSPINHDPLSQVCMHPLTRSTPLLAPSRLARPAQVCRWLLRAGADATATTSEGNTVAMWAAWAGGLAVTRSGA